MNHTAALEEVMALMQALEKEQHHVQHVARLAVHLFDELEDLHGMGDADRLVLESAALLHDIGWSVAPVPTSHTSSMLSAPAIDTAILFVSCVKIMFTTMRPGCNGRATALDSSG